MIKIGPRRRAGDGNYLDEAFALAAHAAAVGRWKGSSAVDMYRRYAMDSNPGLDDVASRYHVAEPNNIGHYSGVRPRSVQVD
ncbi:MAG: hypothetical protein FD165_2111 [Gammaproteobacteria bacterium]|nr:MAG: hypothetical protein FD165_2111 [Gammaproteobacteria bacterium]TND03440.1 MAG: hypothetical protein FD120_1835 [Gammaproteobacteria bacterium]